MKTIILIDAVSKLNVKTFSIIWIHFWLFIHELLLNILVFATYYIIIVHWPITHTFAIPPMQYAHDHVIIAFDYYLLFINYHHIFIIIMRLTPAEFLTDEDFGSRRGRVVCLSDYSRFSSKHSNVHTP